MIHSTQLKLKSAAKAAGAVIISATLMTLAACGGTSHGANTDSQSASSPNGKLTVVASINQWASVAKDLGSDNVNVTSILSNTNVEAHEYEPTTADIAKFSQADIIVVNGADYDSWAVKAAKSTHATVVDAAEVAGKKDGDNPHVWFSADVRAKTANAITAAYTSADSNHAHEYAELNTQWQSKESALEDKIAQTSQTTKDMPYAATESVAWYLADDLKMVDKTPQGYAQASANESEPTPADIRDFQTALGDGSVSVLVYNSQESDATTQQLVDAASAANVPIVKLTEQMPSTYSSLIDWMDALVDDFAKIQ